MSKAEIYSFSEVGAGGRYPDWVRELEGKNGVYLIREGAITGISYIGESHSNRLFDALTQHFRRWTGDHKTAVPVYSRSRVRVSVVMVPKTHARYLQDELICRLEPRDNRSECGDLFIEPDDGKRPPGYDHDIDAIIEVISSEIEIVGGDEE
jgi:hypothetical protein